MTYNNDKILISGSLAYDRIMDFPGRFKDHILPEKIHILNVCFSINGLKESFGGTAGNIAYNLSLLNERPTILSLVGEDFKNYEKWLKKQRVDISRVKKVKGVQTACAYIMTDQDDNQITGFYDGFDGRSYCRIVEKIKNIKLAIIAPEVSTRMLEYARIYRRLRIPYIFDPGQQITNFTEKGLRQAVIGSCILIGNDYEIQLILNILKITLKKLESVVKTIIITKGARGSLIYHQGRQIKIPPAKPKNTCDPTGAGDAYRAGLIKGLINDWPMEKIGRLAGLVSVYTVEKYGTQTHKFTWQTLRKRYKENFNEML